MNLELAQVASLIQVCGKTREDPVSFRGRRGEQNRAAWHIFYLQDGFSSGLFFCVESIL